MYMPDLNIATLKVKAQNFADYERRVPQAH
jgi:hypothetical protein